MTRSDFKFQSVWKPFAVAAALAFLYATVLVKLGKDWWTDENYSHGLLVPIVIGFIVWLEFDNLKKAFRGSSAKLGAAIIAGGLLMLLAGTLGAELFTQRVSLVVALAGTIIYFFGLEILRRLVAPFLLLLLAIPIPQIIFNRIAFPLQLWASQAAVWGIRLFDVTPVRKGNIIEILPRGATQIIPLEVVEACSGIRSLMTLVTLALVLAYFTREEKAKYTFGKTDFWRAVILMLSAVPIAIFTNAARVTSTGVLTYYYGRQSAEGAGHEASGWLVFVVAFALLLLVNFGLKKIQSLRGAAAQNDVNTENRETSGSAVSIFSTYRVVSLIAALFLGGLFINWFEQRGEAAVERQSLNKFPATLGAWRQKGTDTRFSEATESVLRTTDYVMRDYALPDGRAANLYIGYYASQRTGATYHSPQNCLPGAGWEMREPQKIEIKPATGAAFTANRYIVQNGDYRAILIYWYQGRGRAVASEYLDKINVVTDSVWRRRSDGAMARVMLAAGRDENESARIAADLAAQAADNLSPFVPE